MTTTPAAHRRCLGIIGIEGSYCKDENQQKWARRGGSGRICSTCAAITFWCNVTTVEVSVFGHGASSARPAPLGCSCRKYIRMVAWPSKLRLVTTLAWTSETAIKKSKIIVHVWGCSYGCAGHCDGCRMNTKQQVVQDTIGEMGCGDMAAWDWICGRTILRVRASFVICARTDCPCVCMVWTQKPKSEVRMGKTQPCLETTYWLHSFFEIAVFVGFQCHKLVGFRIRQ